MSPPPAALGLASPDRGWSLAAGRLRSVMLIIKCTLSHGHSTSSASPSVGDPAPCKGGAIESPRGGHRLPLRLPRSLDKMRAGRRPQAE